MTPSFSAARAAVGAGVALALLGATLVGCGSIREDAPVGATQATSVRATSTPGPTRSAPSAASTDGTSGAVTATSAPSAPNPGPGPSGVDVTNPPPGVRATGPAVVLVHGGSWVGGDPDLMDAWARTLAASGAVVFNASYRLVYQGGGYPESVDDIACAVRFAREEASRLTTSTELVIMGHSAGAHLAAVVALNGNAFGARCPYPVAAPPDRLVGLAGLYDVRGLGSLFELFVGAPPELQPDWWTAVNPVELAGRRDNLSVRLVLAADDELVAPAQARAFAASLAPDNVTVETVPGAGHNDLLDPITVGLGAIGFDG